MLDQKASRISFQNSFKHSALHGRCVVIFRGHIVDQRALCLRDPQKLEQSGEVSVFEEVLKTCGLRESVRLDLEFERILRRVLDDRVRTLEIQRPRVFTNPKDHLTGERTSFTSEPGNELGRTL